MKNLYRQFKQKFRPGADSSDECAIPPKQLSTADLAEVFFEVTRRLTDQLDIDKGVLVIRDSDQHQLAAVSMWKDGLEQDGLSLNLPDDSSLFEQVAQQGQTYTEGYCDSFSGNFFERKLLLENESRSFVVMPLKAHGRVVGLLGYSSRTPTAFTLCEEGVFDEVAGRLGSVICGETPDIS